MILSDMEYAKIVTLFIVNAVGKNNTDRATVG